MIVCMYFLLSHPTAYQTLQKHLDQSFDDAASPLDPRKLTQIPFLDAIINESMRLTPPLYAPRVVPEGGVTIEGRYIPAGNIISTAGYSQQISEENFYPDPLVRHLVSIHCTLY